jgi:hypothetical protein
MNTIVEKIKPDEFILSVLSPEERLDAAFEIAKEAFKKADLTLEDIENAITILRRKNY